MRGEPVKPVRGEPVKKVCGVFESMFAFVCLCVCFWGRGGFIIKVW